MDDDDGESLQPKKKSKTSGDLPGALVPAPARLTMDLMKCVLPTNDTVLADMCPDVSESCMCVLSIRRAVVNISPMHAGT